MIRKLAKGSDADDFRNEVYFEDLSNEYHKRSDVYLQELMSGEAAHKLLVPATMLRDN